MVASLLLLFLSLFTSVMKCKSGGKKRRPIMDAVSRPSARIQCRRNNRPGTRTASPLLMATTREFRKRRKKDDSSSLYTVAITVCNPQSPSCDDAGSTFSSCPTYKCDWID